MSRLSPAPDWNAIPQELKDLKQWVRWRREGEDGKKKVPKLPSGQGNASASNPSTWGTYEECWENRNKDGCDSGGIGLVLDGYVGGDLDHCFGEDGIPNDDAYAIMAKFNTYAEVSPSGNGIKFIAKGKIPREFLPPPKDEKEPTGIRVKVEGTEKNYEIYDERRFFTITGRIVPGMPAVVNEANGAIPWFFEKYIDPNRSEAQKAAMMVGRVPRAPEATTDDSDRYKSDIDLKRRVKRARGWLGKATGAIAGQRGHDHTLRVAVNVVRGFKIPPAHAFVLLSEWNAKCEPPWNDHDLERKILEAERIGDMAWGEKLTESDESDAPQEWGSSEPDAPVATTPTLPDTRRLMDPFDVLEELIAQDTTIIPTPLPDLTRALGGGFETGHNIVFATQAGGGKTAILVQCAGFSALNGDSEGKPVFSVLALKDGNQRKDTARLAQMAGVDRWELRAKKPEAVKAAREAVQKYREKVKIYDVNQPGACFEDMLQRGLEWVDGRGKLIVGTDSIHVFPVADKAKEEAMQLYERIGYRLQAVHEAAIKHDVLCLTVGQSGRSTYSKRKEEDNADLLTAVAGGHVAENSIDVLIVASKPRGDGLSYLVIPKSRLGGQGGKVPTVYDAKRSLWLAAEHTEQEQVPKQDRAAVREAARAEADRKDQEDLAHYLKNKPEGVTIQGVAKALARDRRWVSRVIAGEFAAKKWVEQVKLEIKDSTGKVQRPDGWVWIRG